MIIIQILISISILRIDSKPENETLRITGPYLPAENLGSLDVRNIDPTDIPSTPSSVPKTTTTTYYMYYTKKSLEEHQNEEQSVQENSAQIEDIVMDDGHTVLLKAKRSVYFNNREHRLFEKRYVKMTPSYEYLSQNLSFCRLLPNFSQNFIYNQNMSNIYVKKLFAKTINFRLKTNFQLIL